MGGDSRGDSTGSVAFMVFLAMVIVLVCWVGLKGLLVVSSSAVKEEEEEWDEFVVSPSLRLSHLPHLDITLPAALATVTHTRRLSYTTLFTTYIHSTFVCVSSRAHDTRVREGNGE